MAISNPPRNEENLGNAELSAVIQAKIAPLDFPKTRDVRRSLEHCGYLGVRFKLLLFDSMTV